MTKSVIILLCLFVPILAHADTCPDGYTKQENGDCTILCAAGYRVENAGELCTEINYSTYYAPNAHTVKYGETSEPYLKPCPATADGTRGIIPVAPGQTLGASASGCFIYVSVRYDASDRGNCVVIPTKPYGCHYESHGDLFAACYYTTGEDGNAIYDKHTTDPATGASRRGCVGCTYIKTCDAGYYATKTSDCGVSPFQMPCSAVGHEYYSPDGDLNRYPCPENTATCGYGECAKSIDDCKPYRTLKSASGISLILQPDKSTTPALAVRMPDGTTWYGATDAGARNTHVNITYQGNPYAVVKPMDLFIELPNGVLVQQKP